MKSIIIFILIFTFSFAVKYPYEITTNAKGEGLKLIFDFKYAPDIARDLSDHKLLLKSDTLYKSQNETISKLITENDKLKKMKADNLKNEKKKAGLVGAGVGSFITLVCTICIRVAITR